MLSPKPVQHHRSRKKHRSRIGFSGAGNVRRRAVTRLKQAVTLADVARGREPHPTDQARTKIRQDVAEHVLGDHHVKSPWLEQHVQRGRIYIRTVGLKLRKIYSPLLEDAAHERVGLQYACLVDASYSSRTAPLAALRRQLECVIEYAFTSGSRDAHRVQCGVSILHHAASARIIKSLGLFAQDDKIDFR